MGFEREALSELYASVWGNRSKMQKEFARGAHGEPFILHELALRGTMTPSQLASSLKASSGRISTVLAALEKKGLITRDIDPDDRRTIEKGKAALVRQGYRFGEINAAVRAFLEEQLEEE